MSGLTGGLNLAAEIIGLIELAGQVGTELYLKLTAIGQLSADDQANIANAINDAIAVDEDTQSKIAAWRVAVGIDPPLPTPPPKDPVIGTAPAAPPAKPDPGKTS